MRNPTPFEVERIEKAPTDDIQSERILSVSIRRRRNFYLLQCLFLWGFFSL